MGQPLNGSLLQRTGLFEVVRRFRFELVDVEFVYRVTSYGIVEKVHIDAPPFLRLVEDQDIDQG